MPPIPAQLRIEQLAHRPDLIATVAGWIYEEWWTEVEGASVGSLIGLLQPHLVPDQMPMTFVASLPGGAVGTAMLLAHDVDTEEWPELSPWLAALYVVPGCRRRGIGASLVNAVVSQARAVGVRVLFLATVDQEVFYRRLGWQTADRRDGKVIMSKSV